MRLFPALLPAVVVLMMVGAPHSYASEVSEVTVGPARSPQSRPVTAHATDYTSTPPSEVTILPGSTSAASSGPHRVAGSESYPGEGTVSEVTIQPGPVAPAPSAREASATAGSPPDGAVKPAATVALPKTKVERAPRKTKPASTRH